MQDSILRFFNGEGQLIPTLREVVEHTVSQLGSEQQQDEQERQWDEEEWRQANRFADILREMGAEQPEDLES